MGWGRVIQISTAYSWLLNALRALSGAVVFCIFVLIAVDVGIRLTIDVAIFLFGQGFGITPWAYSSALVEYGLLWFAMLAAPWLVRIKGYVFIDAVTQMLPPDFQRVLAKVVYVICISATLDRTDRQDRHGVNAVRVADLFPSHIGQAVHRHWAASMGS